mmetsp:Transcript_7584/g.9413  ORF Transcript_7584/g.9413 Transcript_7584/m.9413 type:complete len:169 (+) Transcript_7584:55-561(+)
MGPACGKSHMPEEAGKPEADEDDDWKALLTSGASNAMPAQAQEQKTGQKLETKAQSSVDFQSLPPEPKEPEPYGLIDEYVDDLLGIPQEERPSWQRPSWQQTGSSMDVPKMVLQDGSRGPAAGVPGKQQTSMPTPYMEGVLNGWAAIDRPEVDSTIQPAPKRRVDKSS